MNIILIIAGVIVLLCVFGITLMSFYSNQIKTQQNILEEALWQRRSRIPLLIEIAGRGSAFTEKQKLIDLKDEASSGAYSLLEVVSVEKEITGLVAAVFQKTETDPDLKSDGLYLSLQKEFAEALEQIRHQLNDYNFYVEKLRGGKLQPLYVLFGFLFNVNKRRPLPIF